MSKIKDEHVNMLLCFMNDAIEENGDVPGTIEFDFNVGKEDFLLFKGKTKLSDDIIQQAIKISRSRGYIEHPYMGGGEIYRLTTEGQGRAISVERSKNYTDNSQQPNITIGTINGPAQIGNNNTQNIESVFEYILTEIDNSKASIREKAEAKSLLQKALAHPITSSIIGASVGAILKKLIGGI
jgi:hypothetical protein